MTTIRLETDYCPICGAKLDAASLPGNIETPMPEPGDYTICAYCTAFLEYDNQLRVITMRNETLENLDDESRITLIRLRHYFEKLNEK